MAGTLELASLRPTFDKSIALSLGLTSYVSSAREDGPIVVCRRQEPRDALDQLIQSLEHGKRSQLESSLGRTARQALDQMEEGRSWNTVYQAIWNESAAGAVGYLFEIPGRWSEPEETLKETSDYSGAPLTSDNVALYTQFKNSGGRDCARYRIEFRREDRPNGVIYQVNNSDLADLMRSISACFEQ
jgi:hypothetical protein